jgi:hypothetical protein
MVGVAATAATLSALSWIKPGGSSLQAPTAAPRHSAPAMLLDPADLWRAYETAAETHGLMTDMVTCASINTISDTAAQLTERAVDGGSLQDLRRTARFSVFGVADGAVAHAWFENLDAFVGDDGTLTQTLLKVAGDVLVYSPLWCLWFLTAFVILERRELRSLPSVVRNEWPELIFGHNAFFLPLTGFIYGCVPRSQRVLADELANLVFTTGLSLWCHARHKGDVEPLGASTESTGGSGASEDAHERSPSARREAGGRKEPCMDAAPSS